MGVTSVTKQTLISGFLQLFNLIVAVTAATQVDRLGRRTLLLSSPIGMLICYRPFWFLCPDRQLFDWTSCHSDTLYILRFLRYCIHSSRGFIPSRDLAVSSPLTRSCSCFIFDILGATLQSLCESYCPEQHCVEILYRLRGNSYHDLFYVLLFLSGDKRTQFGRNCCCL